MSTSKIYQISEILLITLFLTQSIQSRMLSIEGYPNRQLNGDNSLSAESSNCENLKRMTDHPEGSGKCGAANGVSYFCDQNLWCSQYDYCGDTAEHKANHQSEFEHQAYLRKKNQCLSGGGCENLKRMTDHPEGSGRCGAVNGVSYFCDQNLWCSQYDYCGDTAEHKANHQSKFENQAYLRKKNQCHSGGDGQRPTPRPSPNPGNPDDSVYNSSQKIVRKSAMT